jgi:RNA methyltransferase, TrmH family
VRRLRQLLRKRGLRNAERVLVVEGAELLAVALTAGVRVEAVYVAPEGADVPAVAEVTGRALAVGARVFDLGPGVMERVASTVTPQPVLAVVGWEPAALDDLVAATFVVVCADVRDPGNVGTVIRTADASGADAVVCCEGTVDPTNPKCVRATAGSLFHLPVVVGGAAVDVVGDLASRGLSTVGASVSGGQDYAEFDWCRPVALVLGNEASGLDAEVAGALDAGVTIPMRGRAESLNVSVAAAVLCFEALRQRRSDRSPGAPPGPSASGSTMPGMDHGPTGRAGGSAGGPG